MNSVLSIRNLSKKFFSGYSTLGFRSDYYSAVNNVSLDLFQNETLGIIGESGCGKTTLGKLMVRLYRPDSGNILFQGVDIARLSESKLAAIRRKIQFIFQDPLSALNPRYTAGDIIREPLESFRICSKKEMEKKVLALLAKVGLERGCIRKYPHELSNGQRQRLGIARAVAPDPEILIADEPVSSLDATMQYQVLELFRDLKAEMGLSLIFISHDLSVVEHFTDRTAVMYGGQIVEMADSRELYDHPLHPYSRALISSSSFLFSERKKETIYLESGDEGLPLRDQGCSFFPRCFMKAKDCADKNSELREISDRHFVRCLLV